MYTHILPLGYIASTFSALPAIIFIFVVQKGNIGTVLFLQKKICAFCKAFAFPCHRYWYMRPLENSRLN
jgi:hypothetical protein